MWAAGVPVFGVCKKPTFMASTNTHNNLELGKIK